MRHSCCQLQTHATFADTPKISLLLQLWHYTETHLVNRKSIQCYLSNPKLCPNWFLIESLPNPLHWGGMSPTQDPLPESRQCTDSSREGHFELVSSFEKQGTWNSFQRYFDFFHKHLVKKIIRVFV